MTEARPLQHSLWAAEVRSGITGALASESDYFLGIVLCGRRNERTGDDSDRKQSLCVLCVVAELLSPRNRNTHKDKLKQKVSRGPSPAHPLEETDPGRQKPPRPGLHCSLKRKALVADILPGSGWDLQTLYFKMCDYDLFATVTCQFRTMAT